MFYSSYLFLVKTLLSIIFGAIFALILINNHSSARASVSAPIEMEYLTISRAAPPPTFNLPSSNPTTERATVVPVNTVLI